MTNNKRTASLDGVLAEYAHASQEFDAKVLQAFIEKYPEHAQALQRYAHVQLTSVPANPLDVAEEYLSDEKMLPRQSKLLQRMQLLRGQPSASDTSEADKKLAAISGVRATQAAAVAVFGSSEHGEDLLLISVIESTTEVADVPEWFYEDLGTHVDAVPTALVASMAMKRQSSVGLQRFSAKEKPVEQPSMTWGQLVEECITDDAVKSAIMKRSKRFRGN